METCMRVAMSLFITLCPNLSCEHKLSSTVWSVYRQFLIVPPALYIHSLLEKHELALTTRELSSNGPSS
jgi:hypothetical protein